MAFWVGWPLWQKLSFVLAGLLIIVLIYAFAVLAFNKFAAKRHAAADQDDEDHPMLEDLTDIPFGARALEKGVRVEGIWTSKDYQPTSHSPKAAAANVQRPLQAHKARETPRIISNSQQSSCTMDDAVPPRERLDNSHPADSFPLRQPSDQDIVKIGPSQNQTIVDQRSKPSTWAGSRSSWVPNTCENAKNHSPLEEHPRTRSELSRYQMSSLFDDNVRMRPPETFRLDGIKYEPIGDIVEPPAQNRFHELQ